MGVFVILYVYLLAVAFLTSLLKNQYKYWLQAVASFFGLWIVLALRSPSCGVDLLQEDDGATYFSYYRAFTGVQLRDIGDIIWGTWRESTGMELGWLLYNKFVSLFFPHFQLFLGTSHPTQVKLLQGKKWTIFDITNLKKQAATDAEFRFNAKDFPHAEIIDLR